MEQKAYKEYKEYTAQLVTAFNKYNSNHPELGPFTAETPLSERATAKHRVQEKRDNLHRLTEEDFKFLRQAYETDRPRLLKADPLFMEPDAQPLTAKEQKNLLKLEKKRASIKGRLKKSSDQLQEHPISGKTSIEKAKSKKSAREATLANINKQIVVLKSKQDAYQTFSQARKDYQANQAYLKSYSGQEYKELKDKDDQALHLVAYSKYKLAHETTTATEKKPYRDVLKKTLSYDSVLRVKDEMERRSHQDFKSSPEYIEALRIARDSMALPHVISLRKAHDAEVFSRPASKLIDSINHKILERRAVKGRDKVKHKTLEALESLHTVLTPLRQDIFSEETQQTAFEALMEYADRNHNVDESVQMEVRMNMHAIRDIPMFRKAYDEAQARHQPKPKSAAVIQRAWRSKVGRNDAANHKAATHLRPQAARRSPDVSSNNHKSGLDRHP